MDIDDWPPKPGSSKRRYRARWRTPAGEQRSQVFDTRRDAVAHLVRMESAKLTGRYVDPKAGRITFKSYAEEWRKLQPHADNTGQAVEQHLRLHVYPHVGSRPIGAIRPSEVQAVVTKSTLAPSTLEVVYGRIVAVFRSAVRDRLIADSPCVDIKLPKPPGRIERVMSTEQVVALADAFGDVVSRGRKYASSRRYRKMILVNAGTGLRPGELFGLTVPSVDFLRRELTVEQQLVRKRGEGVELTSKLKTEASRRTIPLAEVIVDLLAEQLAEWPAHPTMGLIFTNARGGPIQQAPFAAAFETARTAAGLPEWVTPRQLRHHFASLQIARGASVKRVQRLLGHSSSRTTLDVYGHLWEDDDESARAAIEAEMRTVITPQIRAV